MIIPTIDQQIRSVLDQAALDPRTSREVVRELLKLARRASGGDLAPNIKPVGGDDLAIKPVGGDDLAIKPVGGDDLRVGSDGGGATNGQAISPGTIVELVKAAAALGRAKAMVADLRTLRPKLSGEDRAKLEAAVNTLETDLASIDAGYHRYIDTTLAASSAAGRVRGGDRTLHLHLHLEP